MRAEAFRAQRKTVGPGFDPWRQIPMLLLHLGMKEIPGRPFRRVEESAEFGPHHSAVSLIAWIDLRRTAEWGNGDSGRCLFSSAGVAWPVRFLAIILIALLLPLSLSAPSAMACPTTACCGPNCSSTTPVNQLSCCKAPVAPDRATSQARDTQHFDSIAEYARSRGDSRDFSLCGTSSSLKGTRHLTVSLR